MSSVIEMEIQKSKVKALADKGSEVTPHFGRIL